MVNAIKRARQWLAELYSGKAASIGDLAASQDSNRSWIGQQLPLAFLAPEIIKAVDEGRQPADLNLTMLQTIADSSSDWAVQRRMFGAG